MHLLLRTAEPHKPKIEEQLWKISTIEQGRRAVIRDSRITQQRRQEDVGSFRHRTAPHSVAVLLF